MRKLQIHLLTNSDAFWFKMKFTKVDSTCVDLSFEVWRHLSRSRY